MCNPKGYFPQFPAVSSQHHLVIMVEMRQDRKPCLIENCNQAKHRKWELLFWTLSGKGKIVRANEKERERKRRELYVHHRYFMGKALFVDAGLINST